MKWIKEHPNCRSYNWLIYRCLMKCLEKRRKFITGDVVDLGCGEMPYKQYILETADSYLGVDWGATLHLLKADVVADLNQPLSLGDKSADCVFSISVLEHLSEPRIMLSEAHRILRPGGCIVLQVPWQKGIHEAPYDYFRYTPYGLRKLLSDAGFTSIEVDSVSGFFEMVTVKINYFSLRLIRGPKAIKLIVKWILWPLWQLNQLFAVLAGGLDKHSEIEATGYLVVAKRED